ncbi:MAG: hypothetical protein ACRD3R_08100, partial [Terriglobales bacterium]
FCATCAFGALAVIGYAWFVRDRSPDAKAWREAGFLWAFGLAWSLFSFAISFAAIPDALADGEWAVLLVLLFPLIGILVLVSAFFATLRIAGRVFVARGTGSRGASVTLKPARVREVANEGQSARRSANRDPALDQIFGEKR